MSQQVKVYRTLEFYKSSGGSRIASFDTDDSSTILYFRPETDDTGALYFGDGTKDMDVRFTLGSAAVYAEFNVGNTQLNLVGVDLALDSGISTSSTLTFTGTQSLVIGTTGTPLVLTAGTPIFSLYSTNAGTSSTNAEPFYVYSALTGVGGYGGRSRFHTYTNVASGSNVMALKAYMEYGNSGTNNGLSAAFCAELKMPNANTGSGGVYTVLELEYVAGGTTTQTAGSLTGNHAQFMRLTASGDADGDFDDNGYFMVVSGLTAGAAHMLSTTSQTLKCGIGTSTTRYLVLSQAEDGLALGNSTTAQSYTAGTPPLTFYFTNAGTSGSTSAEPFYLKSTLTGTGQVGGRSRFHCYTNVSAGGWVNALKSYMEFGTSGKTTGLASSMCVEMYLPNVNLGSGGAYFPLEIEHVSGGTSLVTAGSLSGNHTGFITMVASGDANGDFDDNGYLFTVSGLTSAAGAGGHLFATGANTGTIAGSLRIGIGTTAYYIPLWSTAVAN